ncbi:MAG TPA: ribosome biogenesis GTPase Der [Candidatus Methylomirabilis sp.]|nr:ribosome biogenesis GTPase Der [Candidatus Methylomirabilis sp.]
MRGRVHYEARSKTRRGGLPVVGTLAIVGRPNVGKSTLFNRLVGSRRAIVGDEPGITRDRLYGEAEWAGRKLRVVDTGGIIPDDKALIPAEIFRQARVALEEADAIVMVVDGRTELAAPDLELARLLQRLGKPLLLAVNKMDTPQLEPYAEEFRRLGIKELLPISAETGNGVAELLEHVYGLMPEVAASELPEELLEEIAEEEGATDEAEPEEEPAPLETKVAIIGRPNVGKSTLLNALTGTGRAIVSPIAGTTRDAVDELVQRDGQTYRFIDTAGIRRKGKTELMAEKLSVVMARKHLEAADVALVVIDAVEGVTAGDATIAGYAHESGRSVIIVINKWDLVTSARTDGKPAADPAIFEQQARRQLKFLNYAPVVFVSASTGKNIPRLYSSLELVAKERRKRVGTGEMNRFLAKVDFERASVPVSKRVRILYMTQAAVSPPTFILFTDRAVKLHFAYQRFLENQIRDAFGFVGTPIWIKTRARNAPSDKR